jgi:hypothetical protein
MAGRNSTHDTLLALLAFAEATEDQYDKNRALIRAPKKMFSHPMDSWRAFKAGDLTKAQTYVADSGECFLLLASFAESSKISFEPSEALLWLASDAVSSDTLAAKKEARKGGLQELLALYADKVLARAVFLKSLLGIYVRAIETDLIKRMMAKESNLAAEARASMERGIKDFQTAFEARLPDFRQRKELVDYVRSLRFPMIPAPVGHKKAESEVLNGVVLSPELARQAKERFAALQAQAGGRAKGKRA